MFLVGHISAYTDFPEEAVEDVSDREVGKILQNAEDDLKNLQTAMILGQKLNRVLKPLL